MDCLEYLKKEFGLKAPTIYKTAKISRQRYYGKRSDKSIRLALSIAKPLAQALDIPEDKIRRAISEYIMKYGSTVDG